MLRSSSSGRLASMQAVAMIASIVLSSLPGIAGSEHSAAAPENGTAGIPTPLKKTIQTEESTTTTVCPVAGRRLQIILLPQPLQGAHAQFHRLPLAAGVLPGPGGFLDLPVRWPVCRQDMPLPSRAVAPGSASLTAAAPPPGAASARPASAPSSVFAPAASSPQAPFLVLLLRRSLAARALGLFALRLFGVALAGSASGLFGWRVWRRRRLDFWAADQAEGSHIGITPLAWIALSWLASGNPWVSAVATINRSAGSPWKLCGN